MDLSKLTVEELLNQVDRTDPVIHILCQRLDQAMDLILTIAENHAKDMVEISVSYTHLTLPTKRIV